MQDRVPLESVEQDAGTPGTDLSPRDAVRMARGFSCLFWSLPVGLLLVSRVLTLRPALRLPSWWLAAWSQVQWPVHLAALALFLAGLFRLRRALPDQRDWQSRVAWAITYALAHGLLSPFLSWWEMQPSSPFLFFNVVALAWTLVLLLQQGNALAARAARALGDTGLYLEGRLAQGMMFWFGSAAVAGFALGQWGVRHGQLDAIFWENWVAGRGVGLVVLTLVLMPLTLTMSVLWKIKELCHRKLAHTVWV